MKYQLVIQLSGDDLDALVRLEDAASEQLGDLGNVDGHDIGSGEMNIFIDTDQPRLAFKRLKPLLPGDCAAAYREADGETYFVLFPPGREHFDVI